MDVPMKVIQCAHCHIPFAMPSRLHEDRRNDHKTFFCPNGHSQYFPGKSDEEKLKDELKRKNNELMSQKDALIASRAALQKAQGEHRERIAEFVKEQFKGGTKTISLAVVQDRFKIKKMREALSDVRIAGMAYGFECKKLSDGKYHIVKKEKK